VPGQGSTFTMWLRAARGNAEAPKESSTVV